MNQELGKYKILDKLGEGATAEVYHAVDSSLDREVALKVLKPALVPDPSAFARFVQEAKAAARLFHNHVATVLDMGESEGRYYIAMRYIEGKSLDKLLKEEGPLSWEETLRMARQIGEALDYAHGEGFLHRDVKPSNIIRDEKGDFWLTDFGLTRAMMSTGLTSHTGAVLGTPSYIAPEIWQGEDAVPATDQYALACVVCEMLTGDVLFTGNTPPAVMTAHIANKIEFVDEQMDLIPQKIQAPLAKALSKDPKERYSDNRSFIRSMEKGRDKQDVGQPILSGVEPESKEESSKGDFKIPKWVWTLGGGVAVMSLLLGLILIVGIAWQVDWIPKPDRKSVV